MAKKINTPEFGPLSGVRVVFSAMEIAGPFSAQMMAEWGAEVIWLEGTSYGDTIRVQKNYSQYFRRNLHSLSINIFSEEGKEAFLKLIETADIFIESSKGPSFERKGLTDELLWEHNPALVIGHLSGYGQYGVEKYMKLPSYDHIAEAFSGYLMQNGDVDQPIPPYPYAGDYFTGFTMLSSCLAALYKAKQTGIGESIDVAMYESLLCVGQYYMIDYFNEGKLYPRQKNGKDPMCAGVGVYKCSDGHIVMDLVGWKQVKGLLTVMGEDHILGKGDYPEGTQMILGETSHAQYLEEKFDAFFAQKTVEEAETLFAQLAVAGTKVLGPQDLESKDQYIARENFIEWESMDGNSVKGINTIPKFKKNPGKVWRAMPHRGLDSETILSEIGYSEEKIQELVDNGIVKVTKEK